MQIKYDPTKDILFIDFTDKLTQLESNEKEPADGVAIISGSKGKTHGIVIYPASKRLPKGFIDKVQEID